jgi:hypothetical protein
MPPAAIAVIAAVVEEHRYAEPAYLARLIAEELGRQGWCTASVPWHDSGRYSRVNSLAL